MYLSSNNNACTLKVRLPANFLTSKILCKNFCTYFYTISAHHFAQILHRFYNCTFCKKICTSDHVKSPIARNFQSSCKVNPRKRRTPCTEFPCKRKYFTNTQFAIYQRSNTTVDTPEKIIAHYFSFPREIITKLPTYKKTKKKVIIFFPQRIFL